MVPKHLFENGRSRWEGKPGPKQRQWIRTRALGSWRGSGGRTWGKKAHFGSSTWGRWASLTAGQP